MGIFSKKDSRDFIGDDLQDVLSQEAKQVILVPNKFDVAIKIDDKTLFDNLLGRKVATGSIVWEKKSKEEENFGDFFELNEFFDKLQLIVEKTIPEGVVQITNKTEIKIDKKKAKKEDICLSKIIDVKNLPDMKEYIRVKSLGDIIKLINAGRFINKFESANKIIYFSFPYYFEEE